MPTATLTSKGQITIPKQVRDALRLEAGDRLEFSIDENGRVLIRAATADLADLDGLLYKGGRKAVSVEEMDLTIGEEVTRHLREDR